MSADWTQFNAEGLLLAGQGQWVGATRAFEQALAAVEAMDGERTVTAVAQDDIRARLLLNIGQCHFHTGALKESRRFAERSCALRVSLYGEDSLVVARTRGDLAVILAASGHTDEAMSLLERAVSAVERKRGEASGHLVPLLTNAARLLTRVAPDRAEPYVARMKALLFAQQQANNAEKFPPTDVPAHSFAAAPSDDHRLREAVAQTADLMRTAEKAKEAEKAERAERAEKAERDERAEEAEAAIEAYGAETNGETISEDPFDQVVTAEIPVHDVETAELHVHDVETAEIRAHDAESADMLAHDAGSTDLLNDDSSAATFHEDDAAVRVAWEYEVPLPVEPPTATRVAVRQPEARSALFDLVEPPPPTLSELPKPGSNGAHSANPSPLGFQVEYGIPTQLHESFDNPTAPLPTGPTEAVMADADLVAPLLANRSGMRAVGGVRRGSTQVVAMHRLWRIGASVAAFGGGIGAVLLYRYLKQLAP